jgi:hypothetical protein
LNACPGFTTISSSATGDTTGGTITSVGRSCGGTPLGPERWYRFVATASGTCHASTSNLATGFDSVLYVRDGCLGTAELGCNDDAAGVGASTVTWSSTLGVSYYIVVDGFGGSFGSYTLTVSCP